MTATSAIAYDTVWLDGALRDARDVRVAPFTHALHYGSGVFEGIRAYADGDDALIFRLDDHVRRLFDSANAYGLQIPYDAFEIAAAVCETIRANDFTNGYIRPLVFFGERGISLAPRYSCPVHVLVALRPLDGSLVGERPARVTVSRWRKTPSGSLPSTVKACGHYTNSILALHDAFAQGFDEALLLNTKGLVAEGTGENIFAVHNGRLITNDADSDILEGLTRDTIVRLARDLDIDVEIRLLDLDDLYGANELFFTGTAAEVMPIAEIDGRRFTAPGPVTELLSLAYAAAVRGRDPDHRHWITRVPIRGGSHGRR